MIFLIIFAAEKTRQDSKPVKKTEWMMEQTEKTDSLLALIRNGKPMTLKQQLRLTVQLSIPAVIAQLSSIVMQYIDAAMVGSLSAEASASIGLVSTTTWLFGGLCAATATGFSVQVAHRIGASDLQGARAVLRQSLTATLAFCLLLAALGAADTLVSCLMNFFSIWAVRLSLAALLAPSIGPKGVWIAMCVELCFRGTIFLVRLKRERWLKPAKFRQ